jgi:hypothetical membrane protein
MLSPTIIALRMGILAPVAYFGVQLLAAPFYPGYSFLSRDASTLGSEGSSLPVIFNVGAIVTGVAALVASIGFVTTLRQLRVRAMVASLTAAAVASGGLGAINAGLYPLPDPRHAGGLLSQLGFGLFLVPILMPAAIWRLPRAETMRRYLVVNGLVLAAMVPVMSGLIQRAAIAAGIELAGYQYFLNNYQGLLQRIVAATVFLPIGVVAHFLARRMEQDEPRQWPD